MGLPNGHYITESGSEMRISGEHGGISTVDFDWLEEGGCFDCAPEPYDQDGYLVWHCAECGGSAAALHLVVPNVKLSGSPALSASPAPTPC